MRLVSADSQALARNIRATGAAAVLAKRYALAIIPPSAVSATHLAVQLVLLASLPPGQFGLFAFLMVVVQLGYGLSNALIASPYAVQAQKPNFGDCDARAFHAVNCVYALAFGLFTGGLALWFGDWTWAMVFAAFSALTMVRWYSRAHAFAHFRPFSVAVSDLAYAAQLLMTVAALWWFGLLSLLSLSVALLLATLLGLAVVGGGFLKAQLHLPRAEQFVTYHMIWRHQSRWALIGVASTEATANAHAYLLTAFAGPAAFAPLAAAALFMKPVSLTITSLTQIERPAMGRALAAADFARADQARRQFLAAGSLVWLAVALATAAILWHWPGLILRPGYAFADIVVATTLQGVIVAIQVVQAPASVLLQAADKFRILAMISLRTCLVSIAAVAMLTAVFSPAWSLAGIVLGQLMMTVQIVHHANRWRKCHG